MFVRHTRRASSSTPTSGAQCCKERRDGERNCISWLVVEDIRADGRIWGIWSARRVAELLKGVFIARRKRLRDQRVSHSRKLANVDEGGSARSPCGLLEQLLPQALAKEITSALKFFGADACSAWFPVQKHSRRKHEKLPSLKLLLRGGAFRSEPQASAQSGP